MTYLLLDGNMYKYGNKHYYAYIPEGSGFGNNKPIEIWQDIGLGHYEVICDTYCKYNAIKIIDALIKVDNEI